MKSEMFRFLMRIFQKKNGSRVSESYIADIDNMLGVRMLKRKILQISKSTKA